MDGSWVKKTVLCFWLVFYTQALHLGLLPVVLESMRPLPAWRAYGFLSFWMIGAIANATLFSLTFVSSPDYILLMGIYMITFLLFAFASWRTVYARWKMCEITRALVRYCERHSLSPSSWRLLLVAAVLTAAFGVFHVAWAIDTFIDSHFALWNKGFWGTALYAIFFLLGWHYNLVFATVLVPVVLLASLVADLRQNCVELLQNVSKNPDAKDSGMQSNEFSPESNEMRQSMLAYTSQLREFNRGNEVHMFAVQIKCQQNGMCTVLWSFDINSGTALQMLSAIVSYTIVMRQSDIHFYESYED